MVSVSSKGNKYSVEYFGTDLVHRDAKGNVIAWQEPDSEEGDDRYR